MVTQTPSVPGPFSTYLAITSLGIGTLLLIMQLCSPNNVSIFISGFLFIIVAVFLNGITLLHLLYHFIVNRTEREIIAIRILILLANIPIALLYANLLFHNN